jgi:RNA polymerase sigma factor (sigma-70 family)
MTTATLRGAVRRVLDRVEDRDDALLGRFLAERDESAFAHLVARHGPMVLGVCRRVLRDTHAADDAFQATFLVLAKKADAVRPPGVLGPWLYGVAFRTALKARGRAVRRRAVEHEYATRNATREHSAEVGDLRPVIDEQLNALPEKYRVPLVLCGVQGLGKHEAAERLGLPEGTVSSRLARGREMLRDRLARRGVVVPGVAILAATPLQAGTPAAVAEVAVGVSPIRPEVLFLSQEVLKTMTLAKWKFLSAIAVAVAVSGGGVGLYAVHADGEKKPKVQEVKKPPVEEVKKPKPATADDPTKPKPEKPKPDGEKPKVQTIKIGGEISGIDATAKKIFVTVKSEKGPVEKVVKVADDVKVFVDGKESTLAAVKKGAFASFAGATATKDGQPPTAAEVRVTGRTVNGLVTATDDKSVTIEIGSKESKEALQLNVGTGSRIQYGKNANAKPTDLQTGDKVTATLTTDGTSALVIQGGSKGDPEKPKPEKKKPDGDDQ